MCLLAFLIVCLGAGVVLSHEAWVWRIGSDKDDSGKLRRHEHRLAPK